MNAPTGTDSGASSGAAADTGIPALRVAMVGNPNVGKTSLFNRLCGLRAKTANFPGSTVEARVGTATLGGGRLELVDLPGVYAIDLELPESRLCRECLAGRLEGCTPDALLVVIDATNLARGLRLFRSVASGGRPRACRARGSTRPSAGSSADPMQSERPTTG